PENERALLTSVWQELALLQAVRQQLMHLDYYWSVWVLGFNDNSQRELWRNLRQHLPVFGYSVLGLAALSLLWLLFYTVRSRQPDTMPAATRLLYKHLATLLRSKPPQQPVSVFLLTCATRYAVHSDWLTQITELYDKALYQNDTQALQQLRHILQHRRTELRRLCRSVKNT
ncbi:MAG TPA: hypothetical protein VFY01_09880, partial [Rheinheimera sp.]|nr:hypothetical protein [Rheinheimera sp.]